MKQIKKKDLKEVIRLTKKWYDLDYGYEWRWDDLECDDGDVLHQELRLARLKAFGSAYTSLNDIVMGIYRLKDKKITLKTYYKVFETLGYELV